MFQGTASNVGKSLLVAGICRILKQEGVRVAPFKAQNMALNSFITPDGGEIGRAQVVQAEAAGLAPEVDMNPILIKPTSDVGAQIIVHGRARGNMSARQYHEFKAQARRLVRDSYQRLARRFAVIVIEGAGSPAEINLRDQDLVNMGLAEMVNAPVALIGDIDRGGVFAALVGTLALLPPKERQRIRGLIINKFRGDKSLLTPGLEELQRRTGKPLLGVVPMLPELYVPEEDGVWLEERRLFGQGAGLRLGVIRLPHISNFTDFDALAREPGVELRYLRPGDQFHGLDVVILPGSKNTIGDLHYLQVTGLAAAIQAHYRQGGEVVGICGGFQMLGEEVADPLGMETAGAVLSGLGLLPVRTVMASEKSIFQVQARLSAALLGDQEVGMLHGYEIHLGQTCREPGTRPLLTILRRNQAACSLPDGALSADGRVWGTYVHGLFDNDSFRRAWLQQRCRLKGISLTEAPNNFCYQDFKEAEYDRLAAHLREHLDLAQLFSWLASGP